MAILVMKAGRMLGLGVPKDLSLVGFDDINWAHLNDPSLTTVHIFLEEMGHFAAKRLIELIEGQHQVPITISLATELVVRQSCGCS